MTKPLTNTLLTNQSLKGRVKNGGLRVGAFEAAFFSNNQKMEVILCSCNFHENNSAIDEKILKEKLLSVEPKDRPKMIEHILDSIKNGKEMTEFEIYCADKWKLWG